MEHLLPQDAQASIQIPYLAHEYDGGEFLTYPERTTCSFAIVDKFVVGGDEDGDMLADGQTWEEYAGGSQTWLFFGLLHAAMSGVGFSQAEFKRIVPGSETMGSFLTTESLPGYLKKRKEFMLSLSEVDRAAKNDHLTSCLRRATTINNNFNYIFYYGDTRPESESLQQTVIAQRLLVEILANTCLDVDATDGGGFHYFSCDRYLRQQMLDAGWCPYSVEFIQANLTTQLQVYAFAMGSVRNRLDHSICDENKGCKRMQAGSDFEAKHVEPDCHCETVHAPVDEVVKALEEGKIPIITITEKKERSGQISFDLLVEGIDLNEPITSLGFLYVAFSHVWADGLGNSLANALPSCQIRRLHTSLASIESSIPESRIWITTSMAENTAYRHNTFAFWMDTLCIPVNPKYQALRDFSISKMRQIYEKAGGVLALDPDLLRLPASSRPVDVMISVLSSGWRSRLWTYQEAALARNLYLAIDGGCFEFDYLISNDLRQTFNEVAGGDEAQGQLLLTAWNPYRKLVWDQFASFLTETNPARALYRMAVSASHRSTSRGGDETICLATFLNLDVTPLLVAKEEDRMPLFLSMLSKVPPEILFAHGKHLERKGLRWAPKSFLLPNEIPVGYDISYPKEYTASENAGIRTVPSPSLHPSGFGLSVFLSSVKFVSAELDASRIFLVETADRGPWEVEVRDTGYDNPWPPPGVAGTRSFVVLLMNMTYCDLGIIAEIDVSPNEHGVALCHWRGVVEVFEPEDKARWTLESGHPITYPGEFVRFQEWVID